MMLAHDRWQMECRQKDADIERLTAERDQAREEQISAVNAMLKAERERDALEAENECLRLNLATDSREADALREEVDRLRPEVERLTAERDQARIEQVSAVNVMLKAEREIKRLTISRDEWRENYQMCDRARDALWGEKERLRAALARYRYAKEFAAADAWDGGSDIRKRFEWASANDGETQLSPDETAEIAGRFHAAFGADEQSEREIEK